MKTSLKTWAGLAMVALAAGAYGASPADELAVVAGVPATPEAGGAAVVAAATTINTNQLFQVAGGTNYSYSFVFDYTRQAMDNVTPGMTYGNYVLPFQCEKSSTHAGYVYDFKAGRYVEVLAYLQQML